MSRIPLPLHVADLSAFARALRRHLDGLGQAPSHLELLNLLTKAAGFRNFSHFRAEAEAMAGQSAPALAAAPQPPAADPKAVQRMLRHYDAEGRLLRWPKKRLERLACLWVLWSRLPARQVMTERQISDLLAALNGFDDHAFLRRQLVDNRLVTRTPDGREYRRVEAQPSPEGLALLERLNH